MKIVTGVGESAHVTSEEFRRIFEGIIGQGTYILESGENMEPELVSNNLLKIRSGIMCHHGNISSVDIYDEVEIANGLQGMKRIDLVVNRYVKNDETKIEKNEWVVIQGTPAAENPVAPEYTVGNMQAGDLVDDCPLFEIHLDGINVTKVKKLIEKPFNIRNEVAQLSNPNLLINSDFRNPINQRGQTSYKCGTSKTYTIDRWFGWELNVTLNDGYIILSTDKSNSFKQILENTLPQDDYTLSIKVKSVSGYASFLYFTDESVHHELSVGLNVFTFNRSVKDVLIYLRENSSVELEWIKLEKGTIATPFVPRLYAEELALCQRYLFKLTPPRVRPTAFSGKNLYFRVHFPRMRIAPSVKIVSNGTSAITLYNTGTWAKISDKTESQLSYETDVDFVDIKVATESYQDCTLNITGCTLTLDSELY